MEILILTVVLIGAVATVDIRENRSND